MISRIDTRVAGLAPAETGEMEQKEKHTAPLLSLFCHFFFIGMVDMVMIVV